MIDTNVYLFAARLGGKKREGQKRKRKNEEDAYLVRLWARQRYVVL